MVDLVVHGGTIADTAGRRQADLAIEDGRIVAVGSCALEGRVEIDARGLLVLPGVIDVHVHFNEPGRENWEGGATGSRALAAGGGTLFLDMPLNSTPCTVTGPAFERKRAALEAVSVTDFGLWGGLVPGHLADMAELAERGAVGFKAFMCASGLPEFPRADDRTLFEGMCQAAQLGLPVAVHAESEELTQPPADSSGSDVRDFLRSRPVAAEVEAIARATALAGEAGARLHLVHVSSGEGVAVAAAARARGVDVSIETCPHYLCFTEDDVERIGAQLKCAPPLRSAEQQQGLWAQLLHGSVDIVASDHSPTEPRHKNGAFASAWGGVAGVQTTLPALLELGHHERALAVERVATLLSGAPARRFNLEGKGALTIGFDADFVLVDPGCAWTVSAGDLQQRHKSSPYLGRRLRGLVRRTVLRGRTIFADGSVTSEPAGRFVRPRR